jgi:ATP-dependent Clp protease ATP-binding subunit ClpC
LIKQVPAVGFRASAEEEKRFEDIKDQVLRELEKRFRPEFLNRVDEIIVFHPLTAEQIRQIVDILMMRVQSELKGQQITLELTDAAKDVLAKEGFDPLLGARPLRRTIQRRIENPLASKLLKGEFSEGDVVVADAENGKIVFTKREDKKSTATTPETEIIEAEESAKKQKPEEAADDGTPKG